MLACPIFSKKKREKQEMAIRSLPTLKYFFQISPRSTKFYLDESQKLITQATA